MNRVLKEGLEVIRKPSRAKKPFMQKTHDMGEPLVDLTKAAAIAAELEDERTIRLMQQDRLKQGK